MKNTASLKETTGGVLGSLGELVVGVLLLVGPMHFTSWIIIGVGIVLIATGLLSVFRYFKTEPVQAAKEQNLMKGLLALLVGCFCAFKSGWFVSTFPVLTMLYGVGILVIGIAKLQWTVDRLRTKDKNWYMPAISAAIALIFAAIILANPFGTTKALWMFIGIGLIVEAVVDILPVVLKKKAA